MTERTVAPTLDDLDAALKKVLQAMGRHLLAQQASQEGREGSVVATVQARLAYQDLGLACTAYNQLVLDAADSAVVDHRTAIVHSTPAPEGETNS